jgi:hypothetical protein
MSRIPRIDPEADTGGARNAPGSTPAGSLTPERQRRLAELMHRWWRARDLGNTLPAEEQAELEALAQAELRASSDEAFTRGVLPP